MVVGGRLRNALCLHVTLTILLLSKSVWSRNEREKIPEWKSDVLFRLNNQEYVNPSPLIGVLTQPHNPRHSKKGASQSISGPLVSWVESAGGRVVPIRYNAPYHELREIFKSINGLVLPVSFVCVFFWEVIVFSSKLKAPIITDVIVVYLV